MRHYTRFVGEHQGELWVVYEAGVAWQATCQTLGDPETQDRNLDGPLGSFFDPIGAGARRIVDGDDAGSRGGGTGIDFIPF